MDYHAIQKQLKFLTKTTKSSISSEAARESFVSYIMYQVDDFESDDEQKMRNIINIYFTKHKSCDLRYGLNSGIKKKFNNFVVILKRKKILYEKREKEMQPGASGAFVFGFVSLGLYSIEFIYLSRIIFLYLCRFRFYIYFFSRLVPIYKISDYLLVCLANEERNQPNR